MGGMRNQASGEHRARAQNCLSPPSSTIGHMVFPKQTKQDCKIIARGGSNINAIRDPSGAHMKSRDKDALSKGATKTAEAMLTSLSKTKTTADGKTKVRLTVATTGIATLF